MSWTFPVDQVMARHHGRITDHDNYIPSVVEAWLEGAARPVLTTTIPEMDLPIPPRDAMLHAANIMGFTTGADYLVVSFDSHVSKTAINPVTNKPWGPNEMQKLCDEQGFCETGIIRDELVVSIVRRSDLKIRMETMPYHFHHGELMEFDDRTLLNEWDKETGTYIGQTGIIPDAMRQALAVDPIETERIEKLAVIFGFDLTEVDPRVDSIMAGIRILQQTAEQQDAPGMYLHQFAATTVPERRALRRVQELFSPQIISKMTT